MDATRPSLVTEMTQYRARRFLRSDVPKSQIHYEARDYDAHPKNNLVLRPASLDESHHRVRQTQSVYHVQDFLSSRFQRPVLIA